MTVDRTEGEPAPCFNCGDRPGTVRWGDSLAVTHGGVQWWCDVCALTVQIEHAEERAARLPELRQRLRAAKGLVPEMALRPDHEFPDELDDVVVKNVRMFRAEAMSPTSWWMACYFENGEHNHEQISFNVSIGKNPKRIVVTAGDMPDQWVDIDAEDQSDDR